MERLRTDFRHALRSLAMSPQFTVPAILGLGVGPSIASLTFPVVNAFLLRPLPVRNGRDPVALSVTKPTTTAPQREQNRSSRVK